MQKNMQNAGSVKKENAVQQSVYESLFDKINLNTVSTAPTFDHYTNNTALSESATNERISVAINVFLKMIQDSAQTVDRLDKSLLDFHIAKLDKLISNQLDNILHHPEFQAIEGTWRGLKFLVDRTDFRQNVKIFCCCTYAIYWFCRSSILW